MAGLRANGKQALAQLAPRKKILMTKSSFLNEEEESEEARLGNFHVICAFCGEKSPASAQMPTLPSQLRRSQESTRFPIKVTRARSTGRLDMPTPMPKPAP